MSHPYFLAGVVALFLAGFVLVRRLPAQNVVFIILVLVVFEAAVDYWHQGGNFIDDATVWPATVIWSRTGVEYLMKPHRQNPNYGLFLIAVTSAAVAGVSLALESPRDAIKRLMMTVPSLIFLAPWFLQKRITTSGGAKE